MSERRDFLAGPDGWPAEMTALRLLTRHAIAGMAARDGAAPPVPDALARAMAALGEQDWSRLTDAAIRRHRIGPVLAPLIGPVFPAPAASVTAFGAEMAQAGRTALAHIAETARLSAMLAEAEITPVVLKGWPLAERLYGGAARRHAMDLDLLMPYEAVARASAQLEAAGYAPFEHTAALLGTRALERESKDLSLYNSDTGLLIEVHWTLYHYRNWPDPLATPGAIAVHDSHPAPVRVLSDQANLVYLSVHGALHAWARLKWLIDIALLAERRGAAALANDLAAADGLKAGTPVRMALRLAARLFGSPLPPQAAAPSPSEERMDARLLAALARGDTAPQSVHNWFWQRAIPIRLAANRDQVLGVLRYDTVRRARLGLAQLALRLRG